jgi:WD40 repeat protein
MNDVIGDIQCSSDGKWMAIMGRYGHIDMMSRETNETIWDIDIVDDRYGVINTYHSYGFFPDSKYLWVCGEFNEGTGVRIYDTAGVLLSFTLIDESNLDNSYYAFLNPEGTNMAISFDGQYTLWYIDTQKQMKKVTEVIGGIGAYNDRYFVTTCGDAAYVYFWDTSRCVSIIEGDGIQLVRLIEDGSRLLLSDDSGISLYNTKSGEKIATLFQAYGSSPGLCFASVSLINDNSEIAIVHRTFPYGGYGSNTQRYLMTFPYLNTFSEVYEEALHQLHGRTFDSEQDFEHIR